MREFGVEVAKKEAEKLRSFLVQEKLLDPARKVLRQKEKIVFPVKGKKPMLGKKIRGHFPLARAVKKRFSANASRPRTLREALQGKLSQEELRFLPSSFDSLGDAIIVEIPPELRRREKIIGNALLEVNASAESVFVKTGAHSGVFRNEPVRLIAGKKKKFAFYREHGCVFRISIGKVFFSPRLATERKRIAGLIKDGEKIAVLFAGAGPFPIVFARNSGMRKAVAIELNPAAFRDMEKNIELNKAGEKIVPVFGDVKEFAGEHAGQFDRVAMPLPMGGENFLEDALVYLKPEGGIIHYYQFVPRTNPFELPLGQIRRACERLGMEFEIVFRRKVREYAPDIIQVVVDFRAWKKINEKKFGNSVPGK